MDAIFVSVGQYFRVRLVRVCLLVLLSIVASIFFVPTAFAQSTYTWTGQVSTDWNNGDNWDKRGLPSGNAVIIPGAPSGGRYPVITTSVPSVADITINSSASLTLNNGASLTAVKNGIAITINNGASLTVNSGALLKVNNTTNTTVNQAIDVLGGSFLNVNGGTIACGEISLAGTINQTGGVIHINFNGTASDPIDDIELRSTGKIIQTGGTIYVKGLDSSNGLIEQNGPEAVFKIHKDFAPSSSGSLKFTSTRGTVEFVATSTSVINYFSGNHIFNNIIVRNGVNYANLFPAGTSVYITGNFTNELNHVSYSPQGSFIFNGTENQTISSVGPNSTLGHLIIDKPNGSTVTLASNIKTTGDFTMTNGTFEPGTNLLNITGGFSSFTGGTINVGASTFAGNYSKNPTPSAGTTVNYNSSVAQAVSNGFPYSNLTISGSGIKSLHGNATVNGNLTVNKGTVLALGSFTLGTPTTIFLENGAIAGAMITGSGTLNLGGNISVSSVGAGTDGALIASRVSLGNNRVITVADDGTSATDLTISGIISGSFGLTKAGAGTMQLAGANTFTGGTTLSNGTLNINHAQALGAVAGTFTINGGTIDNTSGNAITLLNYPQDWSGNFTFTGTNELNLGTGNVTMSASRTVTVTANKLTVGGALAQATHSLTKAGAGILAFGSKDVSLNSLTISAGTLVAPTTNLYLAGNFTNNSTFNHNSGSIIFSGSAAQAIAGTGPINFHNLTFNNTSATIPQVSFSTNNVTAENALTMTSGVVNLAGKTFTLGKSGAVSTLTRAAGTTTNWMYGGTFKRYLPNATTITSSSDNQYGLFPVGASTASSYRPLELNSTGNITATAGYVTVNHEAIAGVTDLNPYYNDNGKDIIQINKSKFTTTASGITAGTFALKATMTGVAEESLDNIRLAVAKGGTSASAVGTHAPATGTMQNPTASRTNITDPSDLNNDFRIALADGTTTPLPITLRSFTGSYTNNSVLLHWVTATETNNHYFTLERSATGNNWQQIGKVNGAGNSSVMRRYTYTDAAPQAGISYYRLKQTDYDGAFEYSSVIAIKTGNDALTSLTIYPNPSHGMFSLSLGGVKEQVRSIEVFDVLGSRVYTSGSFQEMIDLSDRNRGSYYIMVYLDDDTVIRKSIVKH